MDALEEEGTPVCGPTLYTLLMVLRELWTRGLAHWVPTDSLKCIIIQITLVKLGESQTDRGEHRRGLWTEGVGQGDRQMKEGCRDSGQYVCVWTCLRKKLN